MCKCSYYMENLWIYLYVYLLHELTLSSLNLIYLPHVDFQEATVDLKLPRRSLLVHFTCNACGERTQKLINRLAYERGTVFVQCAGCSLHHKLIDNLGLVVEYDFREEQVMDTNADEI
ncbi:hypothetical protein U1Q18_002442 [Sarracenia purpurea var. burkii]